MRTRIAASRSIDVIVLIRLPIISAISPRKYTHWKIKKKTSYVIFRRIYLRGRKHLSILDEILDKSTIFHAPTEHISPRISSFSAVTRVPGTITHKPSYHRMQRMPSILANPPRSIEISNRGSAWRTFLSRSFFFSFSPLSQARRKSETGRMAGGSGGRERERGEGRRN